MDSARVLLVCLLLFVLDCQSCTEKGDKIGKKWTGKSPYYKRTINGKLCQKWSSDDPHKPYPGMVDALIKHTGVNEKDHNYCRNPSADKGGLWCYTTELQTRWEFCRDPPTCQDCKQCLDKTDPKAIKWAGKSSTYQSTISGKKCQKWSSQEPHKPSHTPIDGADHNYCRNPSKAKGGLWCYTTDPKTEWEYCAQPPSCQEWDAKDPRSQKWSGKGALYQKTITGRTCQKWNSNKPHKPWPGMDKSLIKHTGVDDIDHNYCRNPSGDAGGLWCYTTDPKKRWEYCAQPPYCNGMATAFSPPAAAAAGGY